MLGIIDAFVHRSRVTILLLIVIMIWGIHSYITIPKENTPDVKVPIIYTVVNLEGISPQDSERLLLKPLEVKLKAIDGVKEMTSYANEGSAVVLMEFHAGFNSEKALNDVRNKVRDAEYFLPLEAKKPTVNEVNLSLFPVLNVMITGDIPERTLVKLARDLKTKIEAVSGVLEVKIGGDREDALEIIIKPEILENYGLSVTQFQQIIDSNNKLVAAGALRNKSGQFSVKVPSIIEDYETLMKFPVKVSGDVVVTVGDVAEVRRTYKEANNIARVNGKPAVVLEVSKRTGENIINTVANIKQLVEIEKTYWPNNAKLVYSADQSNEIIDMVVDLENNIIIAALLVMIVVLIAVGPRSALLISLSIPISFLAGIMFLSLCGYTLNVVVLFSLILTVGMIVDDAIVVSEYADRIMMQGVPINQAFLIAAKRMLWPVVTSTLVKIVVFMPLLFWPGIVGQFMRYMPITVIAILTNSLLFALFFQPTLGPMFGVPAHAKPKDNWDANSIDHVDLAKLDKFSNAYFISLKKVLEHPKLFVISILGALVGVYSFFIMFGTGVEFFPKIEPESASISIVAPGNLSLEERDTIVKQVEQRIYDMDNEIKVFYIKSGNFDNDTQMPQDTIGNIFIEYVDWSARRKSKVILDDISKRLSDIKGIQIQVTENSGGPPPEKPIVFDITSRNFEKANIVANKIVKYMHSNPDFIQVDDSRPKGSIEWHLAPDRQKAAKYEISVNDIGNTIRLITNGLKISTYRPDDVDEEVDVLLRFPHEYRTVMNLDRTNIVTANGNVVPISNFVTKTSEPKVNQIKKINREKVITLKSDVARGKLADTMLRELKKWIEQANFDEDVDIKFKGEDKDQKEAGTFLMTAFMLTLVMMFTIMLTQFNSYYHTIVVMSAVFLSTVGVLLGLIATWQPFGIVMCGVGIIALGGIVLNNNILFIDTYQHLRRDGVEVYEAIIRAGIQRLRPILLTALTAILGLLPMVFGLTINLIDRELSYDAPASQWWRQLSASIAGGLTFATILTLFFTPCLLLLGRSLDPFNTKQVNQEVNHDKMISNIQ